MNEKVYLLVYTGQCASAVINGIKFTAKTRTANISEAQAKSFMDAKGNSLYADIDITPLAKSDVVPDEGNSNANTSGQSGEAGNANNDGNEGEDGDEGEDAELTVEGLKKANTLEKLQAMAEERELDTTGSKTELAERIVEFEKSK